MNFSPLWLERDTAKVLQRLGYSEAAKWDAEVNKRFTPIRVSQILALRAGCRCGGCLGAKLLSGKPFRDNPPTKPANKRFTHLAIAGEKAVDFAPGRTISFEEWRTRNQSMDSVNYEN